MLAVIRVLTVQDADILEQHGRIITEKFNLPTVSYCIFDQPKGVYDEASEMLAVPKILSVIRTAQEAGAKAVLISCAADPGLLAARAEFSLPVIGAGTALAAMGMAVSEKLGVLNLHGPTPPRIVSLLGPRLIAEDSPEGVTNTTELAAHKEAALQAARRLLDRGADTILLACTGYATIGMADFISEKLAAKVIDAVQAGGAVARYILQEKWRS